MYSFLKPYLFFFFFKYKYILTIFSKNQSTKINKFLSNGHLGLTSIASLMDKEQLKSPPDKTNTINHALTLLLWGKKICNDL